MNFSTDLSNAREALCNLHWLLEGRDGIVHCVTMKHQESPSYRHVRKMSNLIGLG